MAAQTNYIKQRINSQPQQEAPQATTPSVNNVSSSYWGASKPQQTAYQTNLYQPIQTNKWYAGDVPTELEVLGRIGQIYQQDQFRGQKLLNNYRTLQSDPTSAFWNPYLTPTNRAVSNLASLGIDTSNLSDEWFEQNRWLRGHYLYNGTTNAPSKPGKDATPTQLAAYEYHQLEKSWNDTKNAQTEWEALQEELRYMAGLTDRNYSDDEIIERIDWKKYPTLAKMDSARNAGEPLGLNSAIGYSRSALYGTLWAARNDGGSGDPLSDIIYSASGAGKQYEVNPEIRDKLDPESDKWSPFSVGSTMEDARLYFGVSEFSQKWLDDHRYILSGTDQHAIDMYQKVAAAEEHMIVLEDQLSAMYKDIDDMLANGYDEDFIIDTIFSDTENYGELFKLDKSMKTGVLGNGLVDTTRAIDYRRADVEDYIHRESHMQDGMYVPDVVINDNVVLAYTEGRKSRLQDQVTPEPVNTPATDTPEITSENVNAPGETLETTEKPVNNVGSGTAGSTQGDVNAKGANTESEANIVSPQDTSASTAKSAFTESRSSLGVKDREAEIEKAKHQRKNLSTMSPAIHNKGTDAEKTAFSTTNTPDFTAMARGLSGIIIGAKMAQESIEINLGETAARDYLPATKVVREYEGVEKKISDNQAYLEYAKGELAALESRYEAAGGVSAGERYGITELLNSNEADDIRAALESDYDEEKWDAVEKIFNIEYPDSSFTDAAREVFGGTIEGEPSVADFISAYPRVQTGIDHFLNGIPDELVANFRLSDEEMKLMDAWRETIEQVEGAIDADEEKLASMNESYTQAINTRNAIINDYNVARNLFGEDVNTELLDRYEVWADAAGNWNPYPFTGVSPWDESLYKWDQALQNGEDTSDLYSPETLEKYAASTIEDASRRLHFLKVMKDNMDAYGLSPSSEELRNVDQSIETLQKELADAQLFYVSRLPEFDDKVKEGKEMSLDGMSDLTKKNVEFMLHGYKAESLEGGVSSLWSAITGQYSSDPFLDQFFSSSPQDASEFRLREGYIVNYYNAMTQTEKDRYFYLLREEGEQAANDYLKSQMNDTNGTIPRRVSEDITSSWNAYAKSGTGQSIVAELGAFVTNVIGGVENMRNNIRHWGDKNVDPKGIGYVTSEATDALRQGVIENLQSNVSGEEAKEFISVVMNSINSAGDSMINSWLAGGAINAIGESVPALAKAYNWLKNAQAGEYGRLLKFGANALENFSSAVPMGLQAADKAVREARANGANPDQESKIWTVTFLAETLTEAITVGNIRDMWQKGAKGEVVSLFKDYVFNGIEEAVGEGINQYWEENAETLIMGALSEREQYVSALKANGVPLTIAEKMADERMWKNVAIAAASGFLSSGVSQTVSNVIGSVQGTDTAKRVDNMRKSNIALLSEVDTQSSGKSTAVSISAVLQDDSLGKKQDSNAKSHQSDIAAQWFIGNVNNGSSLNAKRSMTGLLSASGNQILAVKEAVTFGSLTSGNTNAVLRDISNAVANGGAVTEENVNELLQAVEEDKTGDRADILADEFNSSVLTGMIANRVMEIIANDDAVAEKIKNSRQNVRDAQSHLESRTEYKEEADAKVEAVAGNVQTAVTEQLENTTAAGNAPVEQNLKQLEGAVEQQAQAELEQQQAEAQLEQAKTDADKVEDDTMNAVREQAQAEVTQQLADEAQQEQDEFQQAIDYYHPVKPFSKPITVAKANGVGSVQLTGVFASPWAGVYMYTTPEGYITDDELDAWADADLPEFDKATEDWKKKDNPVAPEAWMSHSLKAIVLETGEVVDLIGFVGQQDGFDPVVMDANGNVYTSDQIKMEPDPFTGDNGNQALMQAFDDADGENLPEYEAPISADMPEGFVAYPGGAQEMTVNGETHTVVGVMGDFTNGVEYVLNDGTIAPGYQFEGESIDFLDWLQPLVDEQLGINEDEINAVLSESQADNDFTITQEDLDSLTLSEDELAEAFSNAHQATPVTQSGVNQEDVDAAFEDLAVTEMEQQVGVPTQGKVNKETGEPLKDWQDPKYHGKVKNTKKKTDPKSAKFKAWQGLENIPGELRRFFVNPDGTPKVYYRGYSSYLYIKHQSHPFTTSSGDEAYVNFYMDLLSTAKTYAGTNKQVKLRSIKNWETAKAAMQDIGLDLEEAADPNGSGQMGYRVVNTWGSPIGATKIKSWFAENELALFRDTYGGSPKSSGIFAGYLTAKNPLYIYGGGSNYSEVTADVTAPDGAHMDTTMKTRKWAKWAFEHGYDAVIFDQITDNASGYGGDVGVEIVTRDSAQFKSVYNEGTWSKTNPNIMALKTTGKPLPLSAIEKAMGRRLSNEFYDVTDRLNKGEKVSYEEIMELPEIQWVEAHMKKGDSLDYHAYSALKKAKDAQSLYAAGIPEETIQIYKEKGATAAIESLFTPERVNEQHEIIQKILGMGSAVIDENGKVQYTGEVEQGHRVDVLVGLPASGKSTIADVISRLYKSRPIDNDDVKALFSDFNRGLNSNYLHNESRFVHDQILGQAAGRGDNLILPVVGHDFNSVKRQIELLKTQGYEVHLHLTDLAQPKALGRALNRMISPENIRYLPPAYLMSVDPGKINATYERLAKEGIVNASTKWNTDIPKGSNPVLIESSDIGDAGLFSRRGSVGNDISGSSPKGPGIQELKVSTPLTPTQNQAKKTKAKLKSPQDIAQRLAKDLGRSLYATNRFGDLPASVRGFWDTHGKYLALRAKEIGNVNVAFHELGHGIADALGLTGTQQMVNAMVLASPSFATEYTVDQLKDEAFAEFMWRYMLDSQAAIDFAGETFVNSFEQKLLTNQKMYKAVKKAQTALHEWNNATDDARLAATIKYEKSGSRPTFHQFTQNAVSLLMDKSVAAEDITQLMRDVNGKDLPISQNLRAMALLSNHSQKQAVNMLTDNLTDADGTIIGDGLGKMLETVGFKGTEENIHALERYMLAKHSVDRDAQGKPVFAEGVFSSNESRDAYIQRIEATRPDLVNAAKAWQTFRHNFLQAWMVDTGYWSQEFLDNLEEIYPNYVPTFRVGGNVDSMNGVGGKKGRGYTLRAAVGGSQNIYSPFYSFVGMVNQITDMVNLNRTARVFDEIYQQQEGLGYWARQLPEGETDTHFTPDETALNARQQQLLDLLSSEINEDLMEQVLNITKSRPGQRNTDGPSNILTVQREDGTTVRYQFTEDGAELFKLLTGVQEKTNIKVLDILGKMTRTMSMLTTGSNPLFALRNAVRDFQTSVNYGTWASNYLTGAVKWMRAFAEVARGKSDLYQSYKALGGGGWTYIDQGNRKSMKAIESEIFGDDKSTVGKTAKWLGKKVWHTVTMERLNEIIEQASRYAEFRFGKHDTSTVEGRQEAFLASQETSVDFSRNGNSELAFVLKKLVPFFNASTQGVYRTARQFTRGERDRAGVRLAKTVINTALASAIASGLILKFGDDDDKDEFANILSSGIKANHLILPNPMKDKPGEPPFIRIPLAQDPLGYAVHGMVTNAMWNGSADETAISLAATADVILDNLNPLGSGTIMQPFIDVSHNRTWYGSNLVRSNMSDWTDPTGQYNEDTPEVFRVFGRLLNTSPEIVEYLASQYTGFIGATAIPALTKGDQGELGGLGAVIDSVKKKWTADPYSSNDATQRFYSMKADLNTIKGEARQNRPQGLLLRSLTQDAVNNAYAEAEGMLSSNGLVGATSEFISDSYKKIDAVNANDTLSDEEKLVQVREIKREMVRVVEAANRELDAYRKKYITGETLTDRTLGALAKIAYEGAYAHVPTPEEKIPQTFQDDFEEPYMQKALSVFNGSGSGAGKEAALPHPSYAFTLKDKRGNEVECEITPDEVDRYNEVYKQTYTEYMQDQSRSRKDHTPWDMLTEEQQYTRLKNAHSAANKAVRDQYAKDHGYSK